MAIEYVPVYDENGVDVGGYTESVPAVPEQDEPDWNDPDSYHLEAEPMATPVYTKAEKAKRARLLLKGAKRSAGDVSGIERQLDRIDAAARDRGRRKAAAHQRTLDAAKDEVAQARVKERTAPRGPERQAARETRRAAERRLRLVERGAPR
ncbi:hypothetical protein GCM10012287_16770 [Streptomyces daqingensis]|uniref:Uncharacterized protein n=1 Tax=Streptomyces daqingensis TaxID=1472640 RepID=A0ABQ2M3E4_9ACTN|nr:hypothetical protein [Streptomyces daqingensis]GGO46438.1 hypothetical protein GCM10012287_16770 [Streptomyces daqingensis]